jgi:phosphoribosylglycinamide formyltransferase-1
VIELGWFSTGNGEGSRGLLENALHAIKNGNLDARIQFVFCNRGPGEQQGSDQFFEFVQENNIPIVYVSSRDFAREHGKRLSEIRSEYDHAVIKQLEGFEPQLCMFAGYGLITGPEICRRYTILNLHPALPGGPTGTWRQVIWQLIEKTASESGVMIHLATENVDQGPPITYCSFPIQSKLFDAHWEGVQKSSVEIVRQEQGDNYPLFQLIRQEQMRRERPLLIATLNAFATGTLRLEQNQLLDASGHSVSTLCLNEEVEDMLTGKDN